MYTDSCYHPYAAITSKREPPESENRERRQQEGPTPLGEPSPGMVEGPPCAAPHSGPRVYQRPRRSSLLDMPWTDVDGLFDVREDEECVVTQEKQRLNGPLRAKFDEMGRGRLGVHLGFSGGITVVAVEDVKDLVSGGLVVN